MVVRAKIIIITQNAKLHNHKNTAHHLFKKMDKKSGYDFEFTTTSFEMI